VTSHKGERSNVAEDPSWLGLKTFTMIAAAPPQTTAAGSPHKMDFHQAAAPKPTDVKGSLSPRLTNPSSPVALANMSNSRRVSNPVPGAGLITRKACRINGSAKSATQRPIQEFLTGRKVAEEAGNSDHGGSTSFVLRQKTRKFTPA
jgi:hypothetical protein